MPVPKQERTTSNTDPQMGEHVSSPLPDQQAFHEHLRALTRHAVRAVIEEVMREELKAFLGAAWGGTGVVFLALVPLVFFLLS